MIEKLDLNPGRYVTLINKINEIAEIVNSLKSYSDQLEQEFANHTHDVLIGDPANFDSLRHTTTPMITMVNETGDKL